MRTAVQKPDAKSPADSSGRSQADQPPGLGLEPPGELLDLQRIIRGQSASGSKNGPPDDPAKRASTAASWALGGAARELQVVQLKLDEMFGPLKGAAMMPARESAGPNRSSTAAAAGSSAGRSALQEKLVIGQREDPLEHEAERVADTVLRMPEPTSSGGELYDGSSTSPAVVRGRLQRKCAACEEEDEGRRVQRRAGPEGAGDAGEAPPLVGETLRAGLGRPLDAETRAYFEPRFGQDFSQVRVHTDERAGESARSVNALAYTVGQDVVFGAGQYAPAAHEGRKLLAHELTHVVQQTGAAARPESLAVQRAPSAAAPAFGKGQSARIKKPTELADAPDGKGRVNVLGKGKLLGRDTLVEVTDGVSANGWFPILVKEKEFIDKSGHVMPGYLKSPDDVTAAKDPPQAEEKKGEPTGNGSGSPAPASLSAPGYARTTIEGNGTSGGAQLLDKIGGRNVLGSTTGLAKGTLVHLDKDLGANVFHLAVVDESSPHKGRDGVMTGAWLAPAPAPAPPKAAPKEGEKAAEEAKGDNQSGQAGGDPAALAPPPMFIRSSVGATAAVNTEIEYTLQFSLQRSDQPSIRWFHGRMVDGEIKPEREHGFPGHGRVHKHLFEETGQFVVVAIVGVDSPESRVSFTQKVVDATDPESPLSKGEAANNAIGVESWLLGRDRPAVRRGSSGPLLSSANPAPIGGDVEFGLSPLESAKSFFWFIHPTDPNGFQGSSDPRVAGDWQGEWRGMAKQIHRGRKVLVSNSPGSNMTFPAAVRGRYIVGCEERDAGGKELRTSEITQVIGQSSAVNVGGARPPEEFIKESDTALALVASDEQSKKKAVPVRAEFLAKAGGTSSHLTFFIGPKKDGAGLVLIDLQRGVSKRDYEGADTSACFDAFSSKRSYPLGKISFKVQAKPEWGIDAFEKVLDVEPSTADKAIALVGHIAGLAAGPLFFIAPPLAAVLQIISSAANIWENYRTGQVLTERMAIDVTAMAMAFVPLGGELESVLLKEGLRDVAGQVGKFTRIVGLGSGVPNGVLIEKQAIEKLAEINRSTANPDEKQRAMAEALCEFVSSTVLLAIVVKSSLSENPRENQTPKEKNSKQQETPQEKKNSKQQEAPKQQETPKQPTKSDGDGSSTPSEHEPVVREVPVEPKAQSGAPKEGAGHGRLKRVVEVRDPVSGETHHFKLYKDGTMVRCSDECQILARGLRQRIDTIRDKLPAGHDLQNKVDSLTKRANDAIDEGTRVGRLPEAAREAAETKWLDKAAKIERDAQKLEWKVNDMAARGELKGMFQEQRTREHIAKDHDQPYGATDKEVRAGLGMKGDDITAADFVAKNKATGEWLIAESKGVDVGHAVEQFENTVKHLAEKEPTVNAAHVKFKIFVNAEAYEQLQQGGKLSGYKVKDGKLGWVEAGTDKWTATTVDVKGTHVGVDVELAP